MLIEISRYAQGKGSLSANDCIIGTWKGSKFCTFLCGTYRMDDPHNFNELIIIEHISRSKSTLVSSEIF